MDGFQTKVTQSLQFKLSAGLLLAILGVALAAGIFSFGAAFQEANELQDDQLRQMATLVNSHPLPATQTDTQKHDSDGDPESRVILQTLLPAGAKEPHSQPGAIPLRADLPEGLQTLSVNREEWRLFVKTLNSGTRIVVGQQTKLRDEIARESALRTLMPIIILIPLLLLLVGVLIRQVLKPLKQLARDIDGRTEQDAGELSVAHVPSEIRPFLVAINRLLARVSRSVAVQRRFVADAAHELRSPLTALSLQAERLEASDMSAQARERLVTLKSGLQRARMLLDQLLALARAQQETSTDASCISVQRVFRQVLENLVPLAEAKEIDVGVVGAEDIKLVIHEMDIKIIVKNLLDNAIRYTPFGGKIDLSVKDSVNGVILQIDDSGPGISEEERERVLDPFYRVLGNDEVGSGLGLSIVQAIANRVGADIKLGYVNEQLNLGLRVKMIFPVALRCR